MRTRKELNDTWIIDWMELMKIPVWGVADLNEIPTPKDQNGKGFPFAISFAFPMNPEIMIEISNGPTTLYAEEYNLINARINRVSNNLVKEIMEREYRAFPLAASERTDQVNIKAIFPHKTAATRAGLGWIGKNCQLITEDFGPWVRLATVFTDMPLSWNEAIKTNQCGECTNCLDTCPASALYGTKWFPGLSREKIMDVKACDQYKKKTYFDFNEGNNCGICTSACPYGMSSFLNI